MTIKTTLLAACLTLAGSFGAQATTTTYNFDQAVPDSGPFSFSCSVGGPLNVGCSVTHNLSIIPFGYYGYGVDGSPDLQPGQIDGIPGSETLIVTFTHAVKLVNFLLGRVDSNDDFELSLNGGGFSHVGSGFANPYAVGQNVTSFAIRASNNGEGCLPLVGCVGNDDFTLAKMTVAAVPLPAGGLLLVGAFGGLAALRRRRKAA